MRTSLQILDNIQIAEPCKVPWDSMTGDSRARHCDRCDRMVVHLSKLRSADAVTMLESHRYDVCVRLDKGRDGRALTADRASGRGWQWRLATRAAAVFAAVFNLGCMQEHTLQGKPMLEKGITQQAPIEAMQPIGPQAPRPE